MDAKQGSPFSVGRGRGFDLRDNKPQAKTNKERTVPVLIDLGDLNKPGVGPVHFEPSKGKDFDQPLTQGGSDGDSDGDKQVY